MPHRVFKDSVYEEFAEIPKAMGHRKRYELLDLLSQGPRTVEVLAREANSTVANASHHLQALKKAGLVAATKKGLFVTYRLSDGVEMLLDSIRKVAERNRPILERLYRAHFGEATVQPFGKDELLAKVRQGEIIVLDVRPAEEYRAGHVAEALSVPLPELESHLRTLPADKPIVAYCRGRYCVLALKAVMKLQKHGRVAYRLEESVRELKKHGFRIQKGAA